MAPFFVCFRFIGGESTFESPLAKQRDPPFLLFLFSLSKSTFSPNKAKEEEAPLSFFPCPRKSRITDGVEVKSLSPAPSRAEKALLTPNSPTSAPEPMAPEEVEALQKLHSAWDAGHFDARGWFLVVN